ncbi:RDD family protein [Prosthecobacter sp.]|uniref:RDD family protein n=1 Tax=Prosthecobacter sp. TaxID=1965333 RepID=UPI003782D746
MNPNEINPYAAPQSNVGAALPVDIHDQPSAGGGKRFLNFIIDRVAIIGLFFVFAVIVGLLEGMGVIHGFVDNLEDISTLEDIAYTAVASIVYYTFFEGLFGRSLGKLITGTKVVTVSGEPLTFGNALMRSLSRIVPFEPFSFLGSGVDTGWHDSWTSTRVVDLRAAPVPKPRPMAPGQMPRMYVPPQPPR